MKKIIKYKTIILSDIHLGMIDSKVKELTDFLDHNSCETLILNGDIIDAWAIKKGSKFKKSHMKCIRHIMKMSESGTNIIWIRGNHDDFLKDWIGFSLGNLNIVENYDLISNGKKFLVVHGDIFDIYTTNMKWLAMIGSIAYDLALFINRKYNWYRKLLGKPYYSISKQMKDSIKSANIYINKFETHLINLAKSKQYDGVICGHIHYPIIKNIQGVEYYNSGDWIENMTALIETHDGIWKIIKYKYEKK